MKKYQAVILAGGLGRRLKPFTTTIPKPLFPVGNKAIIQIIIEKLKDCNIKKIIISVGYLSELIKAFLGDGSALGVEIKYVHEKIPLGTAGPLNLIKEFVENDFIYMNGDILSDVDFKALFDTHSQNKNIITICTYVKKIESSLGVLELDNAKNVINYHEKPIHKYIISSGIYCINKKVFDLMPAKGKIDMPVLVKTMINKKVEINTFSIKGSWFDIGTYEDLEKAENYTQNIKE